MATVTIVSADKDLAQLVTRRVNMLNVYTGERWGPEEVGGLLLVCHQMYPKGSSRRNGPCSCSGQFFSIRLSTDHQAFVPSTAAVCTLLFSLLFFAVAT